jgi:hypothetical protein
MVALIKNRRPALVLFYAPQGKMRPIGAWIPVLGACNLYYSAGSVFAGPPGDQCLDWRPSAADRAAVQTSGEMR